MISLAGKWVHPARPFDLDALTLGRHLGRVVRFGGALETYYSVLQHSLFVAAIMEADARTPAECLAGLIHDGHEFLRGDVPTDWKTEFDRGPGQAIDFQIRGALNVPPNVPDDCGPGEPCWKFADREALIVEGNIVAPLCRQMMPAKYENDALVARRADVFRRFYVRDPLQAFQRNWNEEWFPRMFAAEFDRLLAGVPS